MENTKILLIMNFPKLSRKLYNPLTMPNPTLSPYLIFGGTCEEAMKFYQSCMGGKLTMQTYGEAPMPCPEHWKKKIIHASLENDSLSFMASDDNETKKVVMGTNVQLSVAGSDAKLLTDMFSKLSTGGTVTTPLEKQFWGDTFGMFADKFGVRWMFNVAEKKG